MAFGSNAVGIAFEGKDQVTPVVRGIRNSMDGFKRDAATGFGLGAGISIFNTATRALGTVVDVMGDAVRMAAAEEASIKQLSQAITANDASWDGNMERIEAVIDRRKALAFADDEQRAGLQRLVATTGDVNEALRLQATAMDLARLRGMDLGAASDLIGKVYAGNLGILSRYGIVLEKGTTATEALAEIQRRAAGQAAAYADTTQGQLVRAQIALDDAMEELGATLTPVVAELARMAADVIPDVVAGFKNIAAELQPLLDAIVMSDPAWSGLKDQIREAGTNAGLSSEEIVGLTDSLKIMYDAARKNTEGLDEQARQSQIAAFIQGQLNEALAGYVPEALKAGDATGRLTMTEEELEAQAKDVAAAIDAIAKQSFPEMRRSGREALAELKTSLEAQGEPLRAIQKETSALNALRRQAARQERGDVVAAIDLRLEELAVLRHGYRVQQDAIDMTRREALDLLRATRQDYSIDIPVDTSDLSRAIGLAGALASRLSSLGGFIGSLATSDLVTGIDKADKPEKADEARARRYRAEANALRDLTRGFDDVASSAG
ncbi:MAG: hypothetical protein ACHQ02_07840, partial [Candidatus Limnocylindrales bacterium]